MANSSTPINKNGHKNIIRAPRNRIANETFNKVYGELLAKAKIWEVKKAQFGRITAHDRGVSISALPDYKGYTALQRPQICQKSMELYDQNELVRPVINLIAAAIFPKGSPDFRGTNKRMVDLAKQIVERNEINFHDLARDAELCGDAFLWFSGRRENTELRLFNWGGVSS